MTVGDGGTRSPADCTVVLRARPGTGDTAFSSTFGPLEGEETVFPGDSILTAGVELSAPRSVADVVAAAGSVPAAMGSTAVVDSMTKLGT